jgi:hypothetical protein
MHGINLGKNKCVQKRAPVFAHERIRGRCDGAAGGACSVHRRLGIGFARSLTEVSATTLSGPTAETHERAGLQHFA